MKSIAQFKQWWKEIRCAHYWRPAIIGRKSVPGRVCDYCEKQEVLSEPEFYAIFGRMPWDYSGRKSHG